jgi:hypothetical protein
MDAVTSTYMPNLKNVAVTYLTFSQACILNQSQDLLLDNSSISADPSSTIEFMKFD